MQYFVARHGSVCAVFGGVPAPRDQRYISFLQIGCFLAAAAGPGGRGSLPVQSVLEVPPALAQPAAGLIDAACLAWRRLPVSTPIAFLSRPWACWLAPFVRSWLPPLATSAFSIKCSR
jgi:hypothetical protein